MYTYIFLQENVRNKKHSLVSAIGVVLVDALDDEDFSSFFLRPFFVDA